MYKGDEKVFVNKQLFWWSASTTLVNNNDVLTDLSHFSHFILLPHASLGLTVCISILFFSFEYFDSLDHYTACWFPLNIKKWLFIPTKSI